MPLLDPSLLKAWDAWALTALIVVALPGFSYFGLYRPMTRAGADGAAPSKVSLYALIGGAQWLVVGALALVARRHHLGWQELGLRLDPLGLTVGLSALLLALATVLALLGYRKGRTASREAFLSQVRRVRFILPATPGETLAFLGFALTTGLCEELLFRGWLIPFLGAWTGSLLLSVLLAALLFGLGHAYQGPKGILQTGLVGLAFGLAYLLVKGLVPLQVLHAAINFGNGMVAARLLAHFGEDAIVGA